MDQAIENFLIFLEEKAMQMKYLLSECQKKTNNMQATIIINDKKTTPLAIQNELGNLIKLIEFCAMDQKCIDEKRTVYKYFDTVSLYVGASPLTLEDKVKIFFSIIQKNCNTLEQQPETIHEIIDLNEFKKIYAPKMELYEFDEMIKNMDLIRIGSSPQELLNEEELLIKQKIEETICITHEENKTFIQMHKNIQEHYFNKLESFNSKDLEIINLSLKNIGVRPKFCSMTMRLLNKKVRKNNLRTDQKIEKSKVEYDYSSLEKEANEAIDLKDMKPKRALSLEEKIYYLGILTRMNVSKEERNLFLRNCEFVHTEENPMLKYMENYNRLKFYEASSGLQNEISNMEKCFNEMTLCSHEDHFFWKNYLEEKLKEIEQWIPKNYEYEVIEAQRLLSK